MKRKLSLLPLVVLGLALAGGTAAAQIPELISYQGVDPTNPSTTITVQVDMFEAATGGTSAWSETHNAVATGPNGEFSIILGSTGTATTNLGSLDWNKAWWLEITINATTITPRTQLTTSPYAFEAMRAQSVDSNAVGVAGLDAMNTPADGQVLSYNAGSGQFEWIAAGSGGGGAIDEIVADPGIVVTNGTGPITRVGIASQGITAGMIANGAVNTQHIAPGAVTSAQIAANGVITQHIGPQQVTLPKINSTGAASGEAIMFDGVQLIYGNPTPGGPAGGELSGMYPNPIIADNVIDGANVIDESLTGDDIMDESLTGDDVQDESLTGDDVQDETLTGDDVMDETLTGDDVMDESLTGDDVLDNTISTDDITNYTIQNEDLDTSIVATHNMIPGNPWTALMTDGSGTVIWDSINTQTIQDFTILNEDMSDESVDSRVIEDNSIQSEDILDETIETVDIADEAVTTVQIEDQTILEEDMAPGDPNTVLQTDGAGIVSWDLITGSHIENETITSVDLATGSVTTDEILNETILAEDISTGAVGSDEILDDAVTSTDIQNETIQAEDIGVGEVTTDEILNGTILTEDIGDSQITNPKIATDAVDSRTIQNESIVAADIATGAVTTDEILDATILEEDIAPGDPNTYLQTDGSSVVYWGPPGAGTIPPSAIVPGPDNTVLVTNPGGVVQWDLVNTPKIADASVTTPKIADGAVTSSKIADGDVQTIDIANDAVTTPKIADLAVTTAKIDNAAVTSGKIADGAVTSAKILDGDVQTVDLADGSVTTPKIADLAVTTAKIDNDAVTTVKILNDAVTSAKIDDETIQPIDIMPSATDDYVLKTVSGAVTWAPDAVTLPWQETDATSGAWSIEITKTGSSEGVFHGVVANAANSQASIFGETNGSGPGVRGTNTGSGDGGEFNATGSGDGVSANASGAGAAVRANNTGTGSAVVATANNATVGTFTAGGNNNGVEATVNGAGDALQATNNGGAGRAGAFSNTNAANANDVVVASSAGPLPNGTAVVNISASNLNGGNGLLSSVSGTGWAGRFSSTGGADGVRIETDDADDAMGLHLERGGMKVSYRVGTPAGGNVAMQDDDVFVIVPDNGAGGSTYTVTFPAAPVDGQIVWIYNQDDDVLLVPAVDRNGALLLGVGYPISVDRGAAFVFSTSVGGWLPVSNN